MALSLLRRHYASSSRPLLFIKSRFLTSKAFLFSAEPSSGSTNGDDIPPPLLEAKDLRAVVAESNQEILKGVNLLVRAGEIHAIVGHDGSGKSTLLKVLLGDPVYRVTGGTILYKGKNLLDLDPRERSEGFVRFNTLRSPYRVTTKLRLNASSDMLRSMRKGFDDRNDELKRRNDIRLLAVLGGELGVLDEIYFQGDEMVEVIAKINVLLARNYHSLMIQDDDRLAKFACISLRHVMEDGKIRTDTRGNWYDMSVKGRGIPCPLVHYLRDIGMVDFNHPGPRPPLSDYSDMLKFPAEVVGADRPVKGAEIGEV